jgi:hypothetical protein
LQALEAHIALLHQTVRGKLGSVDGASFKAGAAAGTPGDVYNDNAVFGALGYGSFGAGFEAAGFNAVQAGDRLELAGDFREGTLGDFFNAPQIDTASRNTMAGLAGDGAGIALDTTLRFMEKNVLFTHALFSIREIFTSVCLGIWE